MTTHEPASPFCIAIFGGAGDLTRRMLMPALFRCHLDKSLPAGDIIGIGRRAMDRASYIDSLAGPYPHSGIDPSSARREWDDFAQRLDYLELDARDPDGYRALVGALDSNKERIRIFYLATAPDLFGEICGHLQEAGLVTPETRVVLEKPIGHDLGSARSINDLVGAAFREDQVFRIDHYLGKETVQNLMVLRFGNALIEPLWGASMIDHVQITVSEQLGVEGRGGYFDHAGALRDMVQNHMLQLVCLVAMEPPNSLDPDAVRDEKLKVLRALRPITGTDVRSKTVRGQYRAGAREGRPVPSYVDEVGVGADSSTETFVALKIEIENWRWVGVPFYLRTGKRLQQRMTEIVVQFKRVPHFIFEQPTGRIPANRIIIRLQPDEGIRLLIEVKQPGRGMALRPVYLNLSFAEAFETRRLDAYERLLMDVIRGDPTLFMRRDEVEAAWLWVEPILEGWRQSDDRPAPYVTGTWGPAPAIALIERDGRTWLEE